MNQLFVVILLFVSSTVIGQISKTHVKGVVTYFFNENYGDKPDVGAMVYFIPDSISDKAVIAELISITTQDDAVARIGRRQHDIDFKNKMLVRSLARYSEEKDKTMRNIQKEMIQRDQDRLKKDSAELNLLISQFEKATTNSLDQFHTKDSLAYNKLNTLKEKSLTNGLTTDGNGAYEIDLPPGRYTVIIVSSHSKGKGTVINVGGSLSINETALSPDKLNFVNAKF